MAKKNSKYHVRTLKTYDSEGRVISTVIEHDLDAMILDNWPELKEKYEQQQKEKGVQKGQILDFNKPASTRSDSE